MLHPARLFAGSSVLFSLGLSHLNSASAQQAPPPHKHALLIGISDYHEVNKSGLFPDLHCDVDVERIKNVLIKTFQFKPDAADNEIVTVTGATETKRAAILAALDRLLEVTQEGDLVYIHYAGHGEQILDPTKSSGLGDSIVPSDYKDDLSNVIKGKEIGDFLRNLKSKKKPSQIVLTMDCCHSGTGARGPSPAAKRGLSYDQYCDWYEKHYMGKRPPAPIPFGAQQRGIAGVSSDLQVPGIVVISACTDEGSAYETSVDGVALGRFSYCLSETLRSATPRTTYREIFSDVKSMFAEKYDDQRPQVDGSPDTYLFGGTAVPPSSSIAVHINTDGNTILEAGRLHFVTENSVFALYARGATEFTNQTKIAEAQVMPDTVSLDTARLKVTPDLKPEDLRGAPAVEIQHNYATPALTLDPDSIRTEVPSHAEAILGMLNDPTTGLNMVRTRLRRGELADLLLYRDKTTKTPNPLEIIRRDTGYSIQKLDDKGDLPKQIFAAMQREARRRYVLDIGSRQAQLNPNGAIHIRLVPAHAEKNIDGDYVFKNDLKTPDGEPMHIGEFFTVEVQNSDPRPLHVAVLDIESSGNISLAWPLKGSLAEDNIVTHTENGKWIKLYIGSDTSQVAFFRCSSADPAEVFKAIGTVEYVPFNALAQGTRRGGPKGAFDDLLGPTVNDRSRGTESAVVVAIDSWTAASTVFKVEDKEKK